MAFNPEIAAGIPKRIDPRLSSRFESSTSSKPELTPVEPKYSWIQYLKDVMEARSTLLPAETWQIPDGLKKQALIKKRETEGELDPKQWLERSNETEKGVKKIIESQTKIVKNVEMNEPYTERSDLQVFFIDGFPLGSIKIEVKSSYKAVGAYKRKIRDDLIDAGELTAQEWYSLTDHEREIRTKIWLTQNNIILINGGVDKNNIEKTDDEILYTSFYPQLLRRVEYKTTGIINISESPRQQTKVSKLVT